MVTLEDEGGLQPDRSGFLKGTEEEKTKASLYSQGNIICDYKYFMGKESTGCGHGGGGGATN